MNNSGLLIHAVLDEISLEGLDGLTIPSEEAKTLSQTSIQIFFHRLVDSIVGSPQFGTATECQLLQSNLDVPVETRLIAVL